MRYDPVSHISQCSQVRESGHAKYPKKQRHSEIIMAVQHKTDKWIPSVTLTSLKPTCTKGDKQES